MQIKQIFDNEANQAAVMHAIVISTIINLFLYSDYIVKVLLTILDALGLGI